MLFAALHNLLAPQLTPTLPTHTSRTRPYTHNIPVETIDNFSDSDDDEDEQVPNEAVEQVPPPAEPEMNAPPTALTEAADLPTPPETQFQLPQKIEAAGLTVAVPVVGVKRARSSEDGSDSPAISSSKKLKTEELSSDAASDDEYDSDVEGSHHQPIAGPSSATTTPSKKHKLRFHPSTMDNWRYSDRDLFQQQRRQNWRAPTPFSSGQVPEGGEGKLAGHPRSLEKERHDARDPRQLRAISPAWSTAVQPPSSPRLPSPEPSDDEVINAGPTLHGFIVRRPIPRRSISQPTPASPSTTTHSKDTDPQALITSSPSPIGTESYPTPKSTPVPQDEIKKEPGFTAKSEPAPPVLTTSTPSNSPTSTPSPALPVDHNIPTSIPITSRSRSSSSSTTSAPTTSPTRASVRVPIILPSLLPLPPPSSPHSSSNVPISATHIRHPTRQHPALAPVTSSSILTSHISCLTSLPPHVQESIAAMREVWCKQAWKNGFSAGVQAQLAQRALAAAVQVEVETEKHSNDDTGEVSSGKGSGKAKDVDTVAPPSLSEEVEFMIHRNINIRNSSSSPGKRKRETVTQESTSKTELDVDNSYTYAASLSSGDVEDDIPLTCSSSSSKSTLDSPGRKVVSAGRKRLKTECSQGVNSCKGKGKGKGKAEECNTDDEL